MPRNRKATGQEISPPQSSKQRQDGKTKFPRMSYTHYSIFWLKLSASEGWVYVYLSACAGTRDVAEASVRDIAEACLINKDTATAALRRLTLLGAIEPLKRSFRRTSCRYRLVPREKVLPLRRL
jgi:hypothetical protein